MKGPARPAPMVKRLRPTVESGLGLSALHPSSSAGVTRALVVGL